MKNYNKHILPALGLAFLTIGAIAVIISLLQAVIALASGEDELLIYAAWIVGSAFVGSWGALLMGVGRIANKD